MAGLDPLALSFLRSHPHDAAVVLAAWPAEALAASLAEAFGAEPRHVLPPLFAALAPAQASDVLAAWPDEHLPGLFAALAVEELAGLLNALPAPTAKRLLDRLSVRRAAAVRRALGHPPGSVGRHMQSRALTLPDGIDVAEARGLLRSTTGVGGVAFVLDTQRRVLGMVRLAELAGSEGATRIESLLRALPLRLKTGQSLASVADLPQWRDHPQLPVLNPRGRFVGVLSHTAVLAAQLDQQGVGDGTGGAGHDTAADLVQGVLMIAETLWIPLARLFAAAAGGRGSETRRARDEPR